MRIPTKILVFLLLPIFLGFSISLAEDQALLIGISEYQDTDANLYSATKDTSLMKVIAKQHLNFSADNITTLKDEAATLAKVTQAFDNLVENSTSEDSVLIFFSGHGVQKPDENGDEEDGCDESLYLHDMQAFTDDMFAEYLEAIQAKEILVIVDSCFSGTLTRSGHNLKAKTFPPQWEIDCNSATNGTTRGVSSFVPRSIRDKDIIALTATDDEQVAFDGQSDSGDGSYFTQTLFDIVRARESISFGELKEVASSVLRGQLYDRAFTPQLDAPQEWETMPISFFNNDDHESDNNSTSDTSAIVSETNVANYDQLIDALMETRDFDIQIESEKQNYVLGELLEFSVYTPQEGYLYIFDRGADQALYLLFPNKFAEDNYVKANETIQIPSERIGAFQFTAIEPVGESVVFALVTNEPLNLTDGTAGKVISSYFTVFETTNVQHLNDAKREIFDKLKNRQIQFGNNFIVLNVTNN